MLINSPNISGSLKVTGNAVITGSLTVLGGINATIEGTAATASYVQYTSVANKPTLVSGSSQISFTGITSKPALVSGSGQISFTGITNKPTLVSGSSQVSFTGITNKPTLVSGSSQISYSGISGKPSGIVSSSTQIAGYNLFATTGSNQFNGSQAITGSLTVTGQVVAQTLNVQQVTSSIVFSSGSNRFGNSLSNRQQFTGSLQVSGSSHYLFGNVGIGKTSPSFKLDILGSDNSQLRLDSSDALDTTIIMDYNGGGSTGRVRIRNANGDLAFNTANSAERMRITSTGNVTIKAPTASGGGVLNLENTTTAVNGQDWGSLNFISNDSSTSASGIRASLVGTSTSFNGDGNLVFSTAPSNGVNTERMRITSTGNVGIGVTPSAWNSAYKAFQFGTTGALFGESGDAANYFTTNTFVDSVGFKYITSDWALGYFQENGVHSWRTAPSGTAGNAISFTQAMTLNASGNLSIGNTNDTYKLDVTGTGRFSSDLRLETGASDLQIIFKNNASGNPRSIVYNVADASFTLNRTSGGAGATFLNTGAATFSSSVTAGSQLSILGTDGGGKILYFTGGTTKYNFMIAAQQNVNNALEITPSSAAGGSTFSTPAVVVTGTGNVGIGTTAPLAKIQTEVGNTTSVGLYSASGLAITSSGGSTGNVYQISFGYGGGGATYGSSAIYGITESSAGYNTGALGFATRSATTDTAPTERMRITSTGLVGIGTDSPTNLIHGYVSSGSIVTVLKLENASATASSGTAISFTEGGTERAKIISQIGTGTTPYLAFENNGSERMRINASGLVQINHTNTAKGNLDVASDVNAVPLVIRGRSTDGEGQVEFWNYAGSTRYGVLGSTSNYSYFGSIANTPLYFLTNSTERMRITSGGNLEFKGSSSAANGDIRQLGFINTANSANVKAAIVAVNGADSDIMSLSFRTSTSSTNISEKLIIAGSGAATFSSSVTATTATLSGSASDRLIMTRTSVGTYHLAISATNRFSIYDPTANVERISITSDGNVGIGTTDPGASLHVVGRQFNAKSGGGGHYKQVVVGQTTAAASTVSKKIAYVGFTHAVRVYIWAHQDTANGSTAIADICTLYGSSSGSTTVESNFGNVTDIVVTYNNGGSPAYTIDVELTYSGTAPIINYIIEGISWDNNIYTL
jgi:hypothetical protein